MASPYCFVPKCRNTKISTPEKIFFNVPTGKIRDKWCSIVQRDKVSQSSHLYCCEDHFTLEKDVVDWTRYKILKSAGKETFRLRLVKGVLPRIFDCQPKRKQAHTTEPRLAFAKRQKIATLQEISFNVDATAEKELEGNALTAPEIVPSDLTVANSPVSRASAERSKLKAMATQTGGGEVGESALTTCEIRSPEVATSPASLSSHQDLWLSSSSSLTNLSPGNPGFANKSCQAQPHYRSKHIQATPRTAEKKIQTMKTCSCFSLIPRCEKTCGAASDLEEDRETMSELNTSIGSVFTLNASTLDNACSDDGDSTDEETVYQHRKSMCFDMTMFMMDDDPRAFLGIDPINMCIISGLEKFANLSKTELYISLRKVRLKETNYLLAKYFNLSPSSISRIINKALPILATFLKTLIIWPDRESIQRSVPTAFFANYSKVESIIDCFEIQIQKPTNSEKQAATWSSYKDCNTVKYLVSMTPDGIVNFVSDGFTGRVSDIAIIKKSGYLDVLKEGTCVMADRGFKEVEAELMKRKCTLERPPSVSNNTKHTAEEVKLTKSIAALRIHVERAIRRVREYKFLEPHATIPHQLLDIVDHAVTISCGLVNLQGPLIR